MRILFATDHVHHPQGAGGAERNTHEMCLELLRQGHEPRVLSSLVPDNTVLAWRARATIKLTGAAFARDETCGYPTWRGWRQEALAATMRAIAPDVVVVQSTHPARLLAAARLAGLPAAAYLHEVAEVDHLADDLRGVPAIANSAFSAGRLLDRCGIACDVVEPIVLPSEYLTRTRPERVLFVNTVPRKGLQVALDLARARPEVPFDFVRSWILDADQLAVLRRQAEAAGNVRVVEPTRDMRPLYARARVLLAPSQWEETWGRVATEAQVNGIPVLGSNRGGLPEAIGPGGIVVPWDAPAGTWIGALDALIEDAGTYMHLSAAALEHSRRDGIKPARLAGKLLAALERTVVASAAG